MRIPGRELIAISAIVLVEWTAPTPVRAQSPSGSLPVEVVPAAGHSSSVVSVAFSLDGRWVASEGGYGDNTVKLWETASGKLVRTFKHSGGSIIQFSRDSRRLFMRSGDDVSMWDIETGASSRDFDMGTGIKAVAVSPGERQLAFERAEKANSAGRRLSLLDIDSGKWAWTRENAHGTFEISKIAFSPDARMVATTSMDTNFVDPTLKLWDARTGQWLHSLAENSFQTSAIAFSPDSRSIAAAVSGREYKYAIYVWNTADGTLLRTFGATQGTINALAFSPDGRFLFSGGDDRPQEWGEHIQVSLDLGAENNIKAWDVATGSLVKSFGSKAGAVHSIAISSDGKQLVSGGETLKIWDTGAGRLLLALPSKFNSIAAVAPSPDGSKIAAHSLRGQVTFWDAKSGSLLHVLQRPSETPPRDVSIAFSSDGTKLVVGGEFYNKDGQALGNKAALLNVRSGKLLHNFEGYGAVAFSPDGRQVLSGGTAHGALGAGGASVKMWDTITGRSLRTFKSNTKSNSDIWAGGRLKAVGFATDGRTIVSVFDDDTAKLWDASTGRLTRSFKLDSFQQGEEANVYGWAVLSPDSRRVFAGPDSRAVHGTSDLIKALDAVTGKVIWTVEARGAAINGPEAWWDSINALAASTDNRYVVTGDYAGKIKLHDGQSGELLRTIGPHTGGVASVAVSPDGKQVYSGGNDPTLKYWSAATGELLASTVIFENGEWVTITPEGFFDASANGASALTVVRGLEVYSVDQVYQALYRPDLVREKLAGDPQGKVREAAAKLDLAKVIASGGAPRVENTAPKSGATVSDEQIMVEATIADQGGGVGKVEWRVNGVTLGLEQRGLGPEASAAKTVSVHRQLKLEPGDNRIEIIAYNAKGLIASEPARIAVKWTGEKASLPPRLFVLAVGVNDYWDSRLKLNFAVPDAKAIGDGLRQAGGNLYERVEVTNVLDADVTVANLDRIFSELAQRMRPRDVFIFFLAGHGKTVDGRYYFLPYDFRYRDEASFVASGVGQDRWQDWFARIPARKSVLLYDTCESGSLTGARVAMRGTESYTAIAKMTRATGRTVLSASTDDTPALEGYRGHGVFTYAALEALGQAHSNAEGLIRVTDLAGYIDEKVPELSYAVFKMRQVPQMNIVGSDFPLVRKTVVLPAAPVQAGTPSIQGKPTHVVIATASVRQSAKPDAPVIMQLSAGTQVQLVETASGWVLVARDGKTLGYLEEKELAPLQ